MSNQSTTVTSRYKRYLLLTLGLLTTLGPFVNNMYSPCLPQMEAYFHTTRQLVQASLTAAMFGLAAGQLLFGPLSDKYGRRAPIIASLVLFLASTIAIIFTTSIEVLLALRFVQGMGAAGGIVIARSVAADLFKGRELIAMIGLIGAANGVAAVILPMAGGKLAQMGGWQLIFVVLIAVALLMMVCTLLMRESLPRERRERGNVFAVFGLFWVLVRNRAFVLYVLHQLAGLFILFGNLSSSSFIAQQHYGLSPMVSSLALGVNGLCLSIGATASMKFSSARKCVRVSCWGTLIGTVFVASVLCFDLGFLAYEVLLNLVLISLGLTLTASTTLALESARNEAGTASAFFGAAGFIAGGVASLLVGLGSSMLHSTATTFVAAAVISFAFAQPMLKRINQ